MNRFVAIRLGALLALLAALGVWYSTGVEVTEWLGDLLTGIGPNAPLLALIFGAVAYALLLSIPFVPGVELGWCIMIVFGKPGIAVAYLATVLGLNLAFALGRWVPRHWVPGRLARLAGQPGGSPEEALRSAASSAPRLQKVLSPLRGLVTGHPLLLLAALFNAPGNFILGGGGGLGVLAGMTTLPWRWYLLTVILATAPIPLLIFLGVFELETLLGIH